MRFRNVFFYARQRKFFVYRKSEKSKWDFSVVVQREKGVVTFWGFKKRKKL